VAIVGGELAGAERLLKNFVENQEKIPTLTSQEREVRMGHL